MAITASEVQSVLREKFVGEGSQVDLHHAPDGSIHGFVVSPNFSEQPVPDRQRTVYDLLRARFGADAQQVKMIFTYSPYEFEEVFSEETA
jgi:stress-induced morphogen